MRITLDGKKTVKDPEHVPPPGSLLLGLMDAGCLLPLLGEGLPGSAAGTRAKSLPQGGAFSWGSCPWPHPSYSLVWGHGPWQSTPQPMGWWLGLTSALSITMDTAGSDGAVSLWAWSPGSWSSFLTWPQPCPSLHRWLGLPSALPCYPALPAPKEQPPSLCYTDGH